MNLSSLRTQAADFCGDPDQTRFSATKYLTALNRAQEQLALDTKALWKDQSYTTASGDADYDLPSTFMWEHWVTYDGKPLDPINRYEAARKWGQDWAEENGEPTHYVVDPEEATKELLLVPIPQEAKTVVMRYFPLPTALASDGDVPLNSSALMAQFHIAICAYGAWLILMGEQATPAIAQKMRQLERIYADGVSKAVDTFKNTASAPLDLPGNAIWG